MATGVGDRTQFPSVRGEFSPRSDPVPGHDTRISVSRVSPETGASLVP